MSAGVVCRVRPDQHIYSSGKVGRARLHFHFQAPIADRISRPLPPPITNHQVCAPWSFPEIGFAFALIINKNSDNCQPPPIKLTPILQAFIYLSTQNGQAWQC